MPPLLLILLVSWWLGYAMTGMRSGYDLSDEWRTEARVFCPSAIDANGVPVSREPVSFTDVARVV